MDELKQSVQLAVHEQKDPLLIYKFEAFELFKGMIASLNREVISFLLKGSILHRTMQFRRPNKLVRNKNLKTTKDDVLNTEEMAKNSVPSVLELVVRHDRSLKPLPVNFPKLEETTK